MATGSLLIRPPTGIVDVIENWAAMPKDARKLRAAQASLLDDRSALCALQRAYMGLYGRRGTDTSQLTMSSYWQGAKRYLNWCSVSGLKPHQAKEEDARRFLASMAGLSPKSRQLYITGARSLFAALCWAGIGEGNPFERARVVDPTPAAGKAVPYTTAELQRLLRAADPFECVIVLLAADAGLRLSESASLTWRGVDFGSKSLSIVGKGKKRARILATDRLMAALAAMPRREPSVLVISPRRIQQVFGRLCERARVPCRGYHALRHTCGTRLYQMTRDILVVQRHLRHSSARTTEVYAHLAEREYREAVTLLDGPVSY